jgi:hypothetical protein
MQAIIVSVDYADLLAITLPYNRHHFTDVMVVTKPTDKKTAAVTEACRCSVLQTDVFNAGGATFNKFAAIEEAVRILRPQGWLCLLDADIMIPKGMADPQQSWHIGKIYSPLRRMWVNTSLQPPPESDWGQLPYGEPRNATRFAGYMQVFHVQDAVLTSRPWHRLDYDNASDGDTEFSRKWAKTNKVRPAFDVLHLGQDSKNWCGRATPYVDGTIPDNAEAKTELVRLFLSKRKAKAK